jgi:hypothetical protein
VDTLGGRRLETFGLSGLIILVGVFLLQSRGVFKKKEMAFYILNAFGAGLLAYYAFSIENIYFAILETIWCLGAAISLGIMFKGKYVQSARAPGGYWQVTFNGGLSGSEYWSKWDGRGLDEKTSGKYTK